MFNQSQKNKAGEVKWKTLVSFKSSKMASNILQKSRNVKYKYIPNIIYSLANTNIPYIGSSNLSSPKSKSFA